MKHPIIILHGWGIDGTRYKELQALLEKDKFKVYSPDLPGFGSESLKKDMNLDDYVKFIQNFIKNNNLHKVILIGHSFGGRVAAKLSAVHPELVSKLVLTGAPLIKEKLSLKKRIIGRVAKAGKQFTPHFIFNVARKVIYRSIGEWDYYRAGKLSKTLENILAEDLKGVLPKIKVPTLIVWADSDTFVPVSIGKEIASLIKSSKLEILQGSHKLPYENPVMFYNSILPFLNS